MKEQLESLNAIMINFGAGGMRIVNILLAVIMFGVALGIKLNLFKEVFKKPKSIIIGLCMQWFALPAVTFAIAMVLNRWITPMIALGMILVASCPGGNISNFMSSFAKGNAELSVSMTAVATILSPFITPFNFYIWGTLYYSVISIHADIPTLVIPFLPMLKEIMLLLGVPIALGMLFAHYFPKITAKIIKPFQYISLSLFVLMVIGAFSQNFDIIIHNILYIFIIVLIHNGLAFGTGFLGGTLGRVPLKDRRSITIEVGIQNSALGLILLFNPAIFSPEIWGGHYGAMLIITAWWGIWHIISGIALASVFRKIPIAEKLESFQV